jgi:PAS domain S-box-containing protein
MDDTESQGGRSDHSPADGAGPDDISVVYVGPDTAARDRLAAVIEETERVSFTATAGADGGRTLAEDVTPDAVVLESDVPAGPDDPLLAGDWSVVLFTDDDPWNIDDGVLDGADSLVEKGAEGSHRLLAEKLRGIVSSRNQSTDQEVALETLASDVPADAGIFLLDGQGRVCWSSVALESLFPVGAGDASPPATDDFYVRLGALLCDQPETLRDVLDQKRTDERRTAHLIDLPGPDGRAWFLHASYPVDAAGPGQRVEVFVPLSTIADRYERLGLFKDLVDNAEDGLFVLDADGRIEYCNGSYAGMLGYERAELLGEHVATLMAEGEIAAGQAAVSESLASGSDTGALDMELVHRDGSAVHVSINGSVRRDKDGSYGGLMGVVRDITERKTRERELEQYRNLVESAGDPMYVLDESGTIQICNAAMAAFVGRSQADLVGADVRALLPAESLDRGRESLRTVLSSEGPSTDSFEMWMPDADGEDHLFEVTVSALTADEEFAGSVATYRDVTARHRRQEELDLRKQIFARSLRHNIRNETSIIRSYGSILAEELDGDYAAMADDILEASRSLARTSEKVSQFDWLVEQDPELVEHDLAPLVARCLEEVRTNNPDAAVTVDVERDITVRGIRDLDVAIHNLLENAFQHGTDDGPPTVTIEATATDDSVRLTVADGGPGIPPSEIEVIQGSQETALKHASGLGLWLVRRVVDQSGGSLSFDVDDGTAVHVRLPRGASR